MISAFPTSFILFVTRDSNAKKKKKKKPAKQNKPFTFPPLQSTIIQAYKVATKRRPPLCPTSKWEIPVCHVKKLPITTCG